MSKTKKIKPIIQCIVCGSSFKAYNKNSKFCCIKCSTKYHYQKKKSRGKLKNIAEHIIGMKTFNICKDLTEGMITNFLLRKEIEKGLYNND